MSEHQSIRTIEQLQQHYAAARPSSTSKISVGLSEKMQEWLSQSPFFTLSTVGRSGIDCSPRGDAPGCAFKVQDSHTILIPDRKGNNRIDSLRNIILDSRVGLVFLIPGIEQALRVKGNAEISVDPNLLSLFEHEGQLPATVIKITVSMAFVQNARAIRSARLWDSSSRAETELLPTAEELSVPLSESNSNPWIISKSASKKEP